MELKTLKDMKSGTHGSVKELKAEAIKWVKSNDRTTDGVRGWIKHFFNLTEEDLK